jgi:hypothetical protein
MTIFKLPALLGVCIAVSPAMAQKSGRDTTPPPPKIGKVEIDRYRELLYRPDDNYIKSPGPVRIVLIDAITGEKTVLIADDAEGSPTGEIIVKGNLRLERSEGVLSGRDLRFKPEGNEGSIRDATTTVGKIRLSGRELDLLPEGGVKARNAEFTTCTLRRPDYKITAREIVVRPNGRVSAKHIQFYIANRKILSLPSFTRTFSRRVSDPLPLPSYNNQNLIQYRLSGEPMSSAREALDYNILLTMRRTPQGGISYERALDTVDPKAEPPRTRQAASFEPLRSPLESSTRILQGSAPDVPDPARATNLFGSLTANSFVYNRKFTNVQVSRLPELGFTFLNLTNRKGEFSGTDGNGVPRAAGLRDVLSPHNWLINGEIAGGWIHELNTKAKGGRFGTRLEAVSPYLRLPGSLRMRVGGTAQSSVYGDASTYTILSPELETTFTPLRNTILGATLRYMDGYGRTPFVYDRIDVRRELRLRYGYYSSGWAADLGVNYDLDRVRAYDMGFSIRRRFDCMEIGIGYQARFQGFNIILNLLPGQIGGSSRSPR